MVGAITFDHYPMPENAKFSYLAIGKKLAYALIVTD